MWEKQTKQTKAVEEKKGRREDGRGADIGTI